MKSSSQNARKHHYNEDFFEVIDNSIKAYWLGFLMADGCIYKGSDKYSYRLQINLKGSDKDHLEKFQKAIGSNYKIQEKKVGKAQSDVVTLKVNSTKMCQDLMKHGVVPRKSLVCQMPDLEENLVPHFIRGYFDGDGCITQDTERQKWSIKIVGGKDILESFQMWLSENNITTQLYETKKKNIYSLETAKHESIWKIYMVLCRTCTSPYTIGSYQGLEFLDRKRDRFAEFHTQYIK